MPVSQPTPLPTAGLAQLSSHVDSTPALQPSPLARLFEQMGYGLSVPSGRFDFNVNTPWGEQQAFNYGALSGMNWQDFATALGKDPTSWWQSSMTNPTGNQVPNIYELRDGRMAFKRPEWANIQPFMQAKTSHQGG